MYRIIMMLAAVLLQACGNDDIPEKDRSVIFHNVSGEQVAVSYIGFTSDSTRRIADIPGTLNSPLVRFKEEGLVIKPDTAVEVHRFSEKTLKRSFEHKVGLIYYVLNIDSLERIPWDTVRATNRGVTIFYFKDYRTLEADSFRIVYPGH